MDAKTLNTIGLILDFIGAFVLIIYSTKILGATTRADQDHTASRCWTLVGYVLIAVGFLVQIFSNVAVAENYTYKSKGVTAYEAITAGKKCEKTSNKLNCTYKIGNDLEFSIDGIGIPETGITFTRTKGVEGDYYATYGLMHGCIIVKHGGHSDLFGKDFAFVSPINGKVYKTWEECKAGH